MDLPCAPTQLHAGAGLQRALQAKAWALLAGGLVAQGHGVPVAHGVGLARRHPGLHLGPGGLQRGIAAAVVAVQVGVENALQCPPAQRRLHQRHGLLCMAAVTRVHHRRPFRASENNAVGRQPAAFQESGVGGQGRGGVGHRECGGRSQRGVNGESKKPSEKRLLIVPTFPAASGCGQTPRRCRGSLRA